MSLIEKPDFYFGGIILLGLIIFGFLSYYYGRKQVVFRKLSKFKRRSINQFRTNELTKITGKALFVHEPLIAPFSKRKCVAYFIKIEQKKSSGKSSYWKTLVKQEDIQDFFIKKGDEVVMVRPTRTPKNYDGFLVEDKTVSSGTFNDPTPEFESLLRRYNIDSTSLFGFNKKLRYSEHIIEVGEEITVAGIAKWKEVKDLVEGYQYSRIAALESSDKQKLIITDHPSAARVDKQIR